MAVDDRTLDVKDILDKATTGWQANPAKPFLIMEDRSNTLASELRQTRTNGTIFIKKDYEMVPEKLSSTFENRLWYFNVVLISQSKVLLQGIFDQFREVFDRYTSAPWATSTLGTGTTYNYARVTRGKVDPRDSKYVMDCNVLLAEYLQAVVIA